MEKRWFVKSRFDSTHVNQIRSELKVDLTVAELLLQRGINNYNLARDFFNPEMDMLHDPFLMKNMDEAVRVLEQAIANERKILLFGDYDVDGTTAVALLHSYLSDFHSKLEYYIPDRYSEGYGLGMSGVQYAVENCIDLMITLDCGVKSVDEIKFAKENGIDVIVCDHHTPGNVLPECVLLNPKQSDCGYPYKELSGCGVGFKLMQGLAQHADLNEKDLFDHLDLVAISIGADIVDVTGENRVLAYQGLKLLNEQPRNAFKELVRVAGKDFPLNLTDVIFTIAPRINAAGRLRSGRYAVELMIAKHDNEIGTLAQEINDDNLMRREIDGKMTAEALGILESLPENDSKKSTVVFKDDWHKGVVGIVASRLTESYYRPTIVLTKSNGKITGSARSVKDFSIYNALLKCEHLLSQFGGHDFAAGLTLEENQLEAFIEGFEDVVAHSITPAMLVPEQEVDLELNFNEIFNSHDNRTQIPKLKRILMRFEPHGPGNMKPVFMSKNVFSVEVRILKDKHLKLIMTQPEHDIQLHGIAFNMVDKIDLVASGLPFDVLYTLEVNRWQNKESLQLNIKDIRESL